MNKEELERELYLFLRLLCSECGEEYYPQDHGWIQPGATERDAQKMVDDYLPKLIGFGWFADANDNVYCPECKPENIKRTKPNT